MKNQQRIYSIFSLFFFSFSDFDFSPQTIEWRSYFKANIFSIQRTENEWKKTCKLRSFELIIQQCCVSEENWEKKVEKKIQRKNVDATEKSIRSAFVCHLSICDRFGKYDSCRAKQTNFTTGPPRYILFIHNPVRIVVIIRHCDKYLDRFLYFQK